MSEAPERMTFVSPDAFARTYDPRLVGDPWAVVEQYYAVLDYADGHHTDTIQAVAEQLDLPKRRVETWIHAENSTPPKPVVGLQEAREKGWIDVDPDTETFRGLNVLTAWIYANGTIPRETWIPEFEIDGGSDLQRIVDTLQEIGTGHQIHRENQTSPATTISPTESGSELGRVLCTLGAPAGRNVNHVTELPVYLTTVDRIHREMFAKTYLESRLQDDSDGTVVDVHEGYPGAFLDQLADLFEEVLDTPAKRDGTRIEFDESPLKITP